MTSPLRMRYAGVSYLDKTRALERGEVQPEGIELEFVGFETVGELFRRMAQDAEFESAEMSLSTFAMMRARGDERLIALPVFPSRAFRHSQVYVHRDAGIDEPGDLRGRRVGVPEYQMTAAVWIRALLQHDYDVAPNAVQWLTGGLITPAYVERLGHEVPRGVSLERIGEDQALEPMLEAGDLDALTTARAPAAFAAGSTATRRLWPDYRTVEEDYYRRTRLFPIMHIVVLSAELADRSPWVVESLLDAFEESRRHGLARLRNQDSLPVMHPWIAAEVEELHDFFGHDPFAPGIAASRHVVETLLDYTYEQGLTDRRLAVEELFHPTALAWEPSA